MKAFGCHVSHRKQIYMGGKKNLPLACMFPHKTLIHTHTHTRVHAFLLYDLDGGGRAGSGL